MTKLFDTDFVIYDKANDKPIRFAICDDIVVFGDKAEAEADRRGDEVVIPTTELPLHWQKELIDRIERNNQPI
tara:strand:+ start:7416 stop:7634 length:219 start_codon:yes stop_codon:yes gene_type:complete